MKYELIKAANDESLIEVGRQAAERASPCEIGHAIRIAILAMAASIPEKREVGNVTGWGRQ